MSYKVRDSKLNCALESLKELSKKRKYGVFRLHPGHVNSEFWEVALGNSCILKTVPQVDFDTVGSFHLGIVLDMFSAPYVMSLSFSLL